MSEVTWEPLANLQNAPGVVHNLHHRHPHKPATNLRRRRRRGDNVKCKESCRDDSVQRIRYGMCVCEREIVETQGVETQKMEYAS